MKTVRDGCQLQPNALSIKLSDQIEQLDELIHAEGTRGRRRTTRFEHCFFWIFESVSDFVLRVSDFRPRSRS
jgi:hypothetical protein